MQNEYHKWKANILNAAKKYRIQKFGYKSGILNVDNPFN